MSFSDEIWERGREGGEVDAFGFVSLVDVFCASSLDRMLTGDKIETATCIAISSKLVARGQYIHQVAKREYSLSSFNSSS